MASTWLQKKAHRYSLHIHSYSFIHCYYDCYDIVICTFHYFFDDDYDVDIDGGDGDGGGGCRGGGVVGGVSVPARA